MKELNDKDFDQLFKNRITKDFPQFEEESWLKMEKKLDRRNRFVFYRNASIILLFLSFGIGLYFIPKKEIAKTEVNAINKTAGIINNNGSSKVNQPKVAATPQTIFFDKRQAKTSKKEFAFESKPAEISAVQVVQDQTEPKQAAEQTIVMAQPVTAQTNEVSNPITAAESTEKEIKKTAKTSRKMPISLALSFGPDFNSTENIIGGKSGLAMGIGVSVGLGKRLSLQTGLNYGTKNYSASRYNYTFNNPNIMPSIAQVNAVCRVLEIPLRASYTIMDNPKNSINFNAGLSSYLMLKENYTYKYTAVSNHADRLVEATNENQHYLSLIDLSATYNIKLKNKKFALGFEPYLKIPLSGIGKGKVPLKSSGISLKLNYDFNKKN